MALQLERAREYAVLRATGVTPGGLFGLIALQTGLMGLLAGLLALPLGLVLAKLLILVINQRAFGWSLQTLVPVQVLFEALLLALAAALLAGLYPAWRMSRTQPAAALREE
jgi:putative ABC transport system permease protein